MPNRTKQPPIKEIKDINIARPLCYKMPNQVPVFLFKNNSEIASIQIVFKKGSFDQEVPLQAFFTARMLSEGTLTFKSHDIAQTIDYYGARLNAEASKDNITIALIVSKKNWSKLLPVLIEIVTAPVFPEKEFKVATNIALQRYLINNEKVKTLSIRKFKEVLFGNHNFYGYNTKKEDFDSLKTVHLKNFHQKYFTTSSCGLVLTGNFIDKNLQELEHHFMHLSQKSCPLSKSLKIESHTEKNHFIHKKGAVQSAIRYGCLAINRLHPDSTALRILIMALGGYFGSRLMNNLREDKGYTYGIGSSLVSLKKAGYITISTQVGNKFLKDSIAQISNEIEKLQTTKIDTNELFIVKNYLLGSLLRSTDGHLNLSNLTTMLFNYDLDFNYLDSYIHQIKQTTSEEMLITAQNYLNKDNFYTVVAGG